MLANDWHALEQQMTLLADGATLIVGTHDFADGLTFLRVLQLWRQRARGARRLHYLSHQRHPTSLITSSDYPELALLAAELATQWYLLLPGMQRLHLATNVELSVQIGAETPNFPATTFYIAAGAAQPNVAPKAVASAKPWFSHSPRLPLAAKQVAIIGAGISGAATAYSLARRGYQVNVYEKNPQPALEASGNYQGVLYGSWSGSGAELMELSCSSYRYSHHLITQLLTKNHDYLACGLIQLAHNQQQQQRNQQLQAAQLPADLFSYLTAPAIATLTQQKIALPIDGLYFPHGLCLKPPALVAKLLDHPNIKLITNCEISSIAHSPEGWQLTAPSQQLVAPNLVLCNAYWVNQFQQTAHLGLRKIRGQTSQVPSENTLATVLCGGGYITPCQNGQFTLGATFKFADDSLAIRASEHQENLAVFSPIIPELIAAINGATLGGQANFRTSSSDYLPIVGPIADYQSFCHNYAALRHDKNYRLTTPCTYHPNLYLNIAHGAKGLLTAPLAAEVIADYISQTPFACSEKLRQALHPNRFYVKDLIRNRG